MIANLMLASKPRICPMSFLKIFFSLPSAAHWCPPCLQPLCFEVYSAFEVFIPNQNYSLQFLTWQRSHGAL